MNDNDINAIDRKINQSAMDNVKGIKFSFFNLESNIEFNEKVIYIKYKLNNISIKGK